VHTLFKTWNSPALWCMLNHGNTLVQLLHCPSLPSCQLESTLPPAAQLLLSQSPQGDLVRHHLWISNVLERVSRPSCELLYATNTSHRKQETFLYEYPLPTKNAQQNAALQYYTPQHSRHFDYCNQPLNMCLCICCLDCHEAGLCCYLVIHVENLLHLFYFHLWPIYWLPHI
jgi:hypothetical protein